MEEIRDQLHQLVNRLPQSKLGSALAALTEPMSDDVIKPKRLYHYTNQSALFSILNTKQIWATHYKYLNDYEELLNGIKSCFNYINDIEPCFDSSLNFIKDRMFYITVFSLSAERDLLSQWRGYCPPTGGVCNRVRLL